MPQEIIETKEDLVAVAEAETSAAKRKQILQYVKQKIEKREQQRKSIGELEAKLAETEKEIEAIRSGDYSDIAFRSECEVSSGVMIGSLSPFNYPTEWGKPSGFMYGPR